MISLPERSPSDVASFRTKLLVAMMLLVSAFTALGLFFSQHNVAIAAKRDLQRQFQSELTALHAIQDVRDAAIAERCRALARKPRIHAALEDNAVDLLYPSARDELVDMTAGEDGTPRETPSFHARFYRFLDGHGGLISPPAAQAVGNLSPEEESQLALPAVPTKPQIGYLLRKANGTEDKIDEVIAMPIFSTETGETISALVLGFRPFEIGGKGADAEIKSGIWLNGRLQMPLLRESARNVLAAQITRMIAAPDHSESSLAVQVDGSPCLLFYKLLNPDSPFPPAYEICIYPLTEALQRQRQLLWQFIGAGALLLLGALAASHLLSRRLSRPVERLAVDSEENRAQRKRAETALELTSEELQRSARFSADASHQLKTPVTVLRAGLEELLAGERLSSEAREEVADLVHQTFRLTSVIEDLLLLSRMDAGRLQIEFGPVDLTRLIEAWLDDLGALPDPLNLEVETNIEPALLIAGEKRYTTLILQNLLENARKYNRPGGRIRIAARKEGIWVILSVGNTGATISPAAQSHIFERFHRGSAGENVPGHGLGLNLARELVRLHRGDLRLVRSESNWTEFEARFRVAQPAVAAREIA